MEATMDNEIKAGAVTPADTGLRVSIIFAKKEVGAVVFQKTPRVSEDGTLTDEAWDFAESYANNIADFAPPRHDWSCMPSSMILSLIKGLAWIAIKQYR